MPFADVNGQHIYYEDTGGDGTPIIFLHGFMFDHEQFEHQIPALRDEFRCITFDSRGFGQTPLTGPFTFWDEAEDALALAAHLGADPAFYVGVSKGGFIAFRQALLAPERVLGIVTIGTPPAPEPPAIQKQKRAELTEWVNDGPSDELLEIFAALSFPPSGYDYSAWKEKWRNWPRDEIFTLFDGLSAREDMTPRLSEITAPTMVLTGEFDLLSVEEAKAMADGLGNCDSFLELPGAYHAANVTHSDTVNPLIAEFVRRHTP